MLILLSFYCHFNLIIVCKVTESSRLHCRHSIGHNLLITLINSLQANMHLFAWPHKLG
jgi:hypothetical protein